MITRISIKDWDELPVQAVCDSAIEALEQGKILHFEQLSFQLTANEKKFLTPYSIEMGRKNISFDLKNNTIKGVNANIARSAETIQSMMKRYAEYSENLLFRLMPQYKKECITGRTSFRPVEISSRAPLSVHKDDRLIHVDAFPTTPVGNKRILRLFTNINPHQQPRRWRLGEDFIEVSKRFTPKIKKPLPLSRSIKSILGLTRGYQTLYDHYMLKMHHAMKTDHGYQDKLTKTFDFASGSSWLVYTDKVSHAATKGQYLLEQTFYLPVNAMKNPEESPQHILQELLKRRLI